jgi:hypothetical protein
MCLLLHNPLFWLAEAVSVGAMQAQPQSLIRIYVNPVHVIATVKTPTGELVGGLRREDFQVYDNGVAQEVSVFVSLTNSLKTLHGEGGTSLYDAISFAARALENRQGRKVIIVVTDGGDTTSARTLKQALAAAQYADAVIYPVVVIPITNDAGRNIGGEHALEFMADSTGGHAFLPSLGAELDRAFTDIIDELRTQYLLGFYPRDAPLTKDRFHKLDICVQHPELRVSARNGYYGEADNGPGTSDARIAITPEALKNRR